ncbi:hypothetical protein [Celeribacter marinus]|uniref:hypothetical protein n=1 Tax=Celeribacter marinus TaxID=1397108 RepID=UPI0011607102|nr:hypothetical protein [Celeribacter marinus]
MAENAGLKTTQKFSPDYSSILLKDDRGRQGRFDIVQHIIVPAGQDWDECWYDLARSLQELFDWKAPSPDFSDDEITCDPF